MQTNLTYGKAMDYLFGQPEGQGKIKKIGWILGRYLYWSRTIVWLQLSEDPEDVVEYQNWSEYNLNADFDSQWEVVE